MAININYKQVLVAGGVVGGGASIAAMSRGDDDSKVANTVLAGAGAAGGAWFTGRYAGPQLMWTRAESALNQMHKRQIQVFLDAKTGAINKVANHAAYAEESVAKVEKAYKLAMQAAAPPRAWVGIAAGVGAALSGAVIYGLTDKLD